MPQKEVKTIRRKKLKAEIPLDIKLSLVNITIIKEYEDGNKKYEVTVAVNGRMKYRYDIKAKNLNEVKKQMNERILDRI